MAKRTPTRSAQRAQERDYDSVLLRSAESLGRMIGALQRQIDQIARHLPSTNGSSGGNGAKAKGGAKKKMKKKAVRSR